MQAQLMAAEIITVRHCGQGYKDDLNTFSDCIMSSATEWVPDDRYWMKKTTFGDNQFWWMVSTAEQPWQINHGTPVPGPLISGGPKYVKIKK